jgi:hypothetical protein
MVLILSRFLNVEGVRVLGNNTIEISVVTAGNNSYVTVKKTIKQPGILQKADQGETYAGAVDLVLSIAPSEESGESPVHTERIYFTPEQEEVFRFVVPFKGKKIIILMEADTEWALFTITP